MKRVLNEVAGVECAARPRWEPAPALQQGPRPPGSCPAGPPGRRRDSELEVRGMDPARRAPSPPAASAATVGKQDTSTAASVRFWFHERLIPIGGGFDSRRKRISRVLRAWRSSGCYWSWGSAPRPPPTVSAGPGGAGGGQQHLYMPTSGGCPTRGERRGRHGGRPRARRVRRDHGQGCRPTSR